MSQQNITTLQSAINTQLADNTSGDISAADVRDNLINMTDSLLFNSGSQGITGSLTATSFTGSLQGTSSYATQALSASWAPSTGGSSFPYTGSALITGSLGITGSLTQQNGDVALGVADMFGNRNINVIFSGPNEFITLGAGDSNSKPNRLQLYSSTGVAQLIAANDILLLSPTVTVSSSLLVEKGITGSLLGTATTASYVLNAVNATNATNADNVYIDTANDNNEYSVTFVANTGTFTPLFADTFSGITFNPSTNKLTVGIISASAGFTGSLLGTATTASYALTATTASYALTASMLLGSVTSASYASTASLSEETIGAGLYGGEIQFKGGTGIGSPNGKNTYSSAFTWNTFTDGLNIGDPNTTGGNGAYYLAVGVDSLANGNYSVAFGSGSLASGVGSFTHGKAITANGEYSHAEGFTTRASGSYSHAEGYFTLASGISSHAEGYYTTSSGIYSHAEGYFAQTKGDYSHAEGYFTISSGSFSHAEGSATTAQGDYSHTEGNGAVASGSFSHAEGENTIASGDSSHAEGIGSISSGVHSHAEGQYTQAKGTASHSEGVGTVALGNFSHAEGFETVASGSFQHVQGRYNTHGDISSLFIIGNGNIDTEVRSDAFKVKESGSIVLPTTQSAAPSWTGTDGEMVFATVTGNHRFYVWMAGAWRSGSLS